MMLGAGLACAFAGCHKAPSIAAPAARWTMHIGRARHPLALSSDGTIYALLDTGVLMAISAAGEVEWTQQAASSDKLAIGPAIATDGAIYIMGHNRLAIFDHNGATRTGMTLGTSGAGYGMAITEDRLYAQCMRAGLCAFSLGIMGPNWLWHLSQNGAAPIVLPNGAVVFGYDSLVAVHSTPQSTDWIYPKGGSLIPDDEHPNWYDVSPMGYAHVGVTGLSAGSDGTIFVNQPNGLTALDESGQLKWEFQMQSIDGREAVLNADGTIYLPSQDHHLYAVWPDGKVQWKIHTDGLAGQPLLGSAGTIFFIDGRTLRAVGPDGRSKWSTELGSEILAYNSDSIPTLSDDGTLYIASSAGTLYAFPVGESLMSSAWPKFQANLRNSGQVNQ